MSQAGIVDVESSHPQIPTVFVANSGTAIPIANTLEILGTSVSAHGIPLETTASGNTLTIAAQYASASASSLAANAGLASFNSADFTVDANEFVSSIPISTAINFITDSGTATTSGGDITFLANPTCGSSVLFTGSGSEVDLNVSDASFNTIIGQNSGSVNAVNGSVNTGLGYAVLSSLNGSLTQGNNNTAVGYAALNSCALGNGNTAVGQSSLILATADASTAVGDSSLSSLTSGSFNTGIGSNALGSVSAGSYNIALGYVAGNSYSSSESNNIVIGNTGTASESNVIRIGSQGSGDGEQDTCYIAGITGVSVSNLEFVTINTSTGQLGSSSASPVITIDGDSGSATGSTITFNAVSNTGTSAKFTASGSTVDLIATDANQNTFWGYLSGGSSPRVSASNNCAFGYSSLNSLNVGNYNSAFGWESLKSCANGQFNVAVGWEALTLATSTGSTAIGTSCLGAVTSGAYNIGIGVDAGSNYVGSEGNNIVIGNYGVASESHVIRIGTQGSSTAQQNACYIAGIEGVSVSNKNIVTINTSTGQLGSDASVAVAQGGTGATTLTGVLTGNGTSAFTASAVTQYAVLVGGASNAVASTAVGGTGTVLQGNTGAAPTYSTATYPSTTTVNQILYSSSANVVAGLATANNGVLTTGTTGIPAITQLASNGQLIIGSASGAPIAAVLTAGAGISITNGANSISIAANDVAFAYTNVNNGASPYTVLSSDEYISVDCSGGAVTLKFPNAPVANRTWVVKDRTGSAATNNISITTVGGSVTIDGQTTYTIDSNYSAVNILANATPTYEIY